MFRLAEHRLPMIRPLGSSCQIGSAAFASAVAPWLLIKTLLAGATPMLLSRSESSSGGDMRNPVMLALVMGLLFLAAPLRSAEAATISSAELDEDSSAIFVIGDIERGDGAKFRAEAGKHNNAMVLLESNGGSTAAAIEIGEAIRLKGFATAVINDSHCNSACALVWLAGTPRALSKSARVGFHASYTETGGRQTESGVGNAIVGRYLTLLNLPERAIVFATTAPPSELNWLDATNYKSTGIEVSLMSDMDLKSSSASSKQMSKTSEEVTRWGSAGSWGIYIDHTLDEGCFLLGNFDNGTFFRIGNDARSGEYYAIVGNDDWRSLSEGSSHKLTFRFDDQTPWNVPTTAKRIGESIMLITNFSDATFWAEFVRSNALRVYRGDKFITGISLAGTSSGFSELVSCQKVQNSQKRNRDPFAD
jgi:hypothetical protein